MFCPQCGNPCGNRCGDSSGDSGDNQARFCAHCGSRLPLAAQADQAAPPLERAAQAPDEFYRAVLGASRQDYYLRVFRRFDGDGRAGVSWHWPAFFLTFYWLLYRKMWRNALIYFVLPYLVMITLGIVGALLGESDSTGTAVALGVLLYWIATFVIPALYANALYYRHCKARIAQARASSDDVQRQLGMLSGKGGTSNVILIVVLVVFVVAVIGVLAAIAIPAYQDYTTRARLSEAVTVASSAAVSVAEYYGEHQTIPESLAIAGFSGALPPAVSKISIDGDSGVLRITLATAPVEGKSLLWVPSLDESDKVVWQCMSQDIPGKYLPPRCRQ